MNDVLTRRLEQYNANYAQLMELAKGVTVYFNDNSQYYHAADSCVNMPTADEHTLYEALEKGLKHCGNCDPCELEDLEGQIQ